MLISCDIDSNSIERLLRTTKKALNLGLEVKRVEISPSRHGFHLVLDDHNGNNKINDIMTRALLQDDAIRLRYSIMRMAMGGEVDICFDRKNGNNSIPIKIDLKELEKTDVLETDKLVPKYEKKIGKYMKKNFLLVFEIPDAFEEKIRTVLQDIANRDSTFRYKVYPNLYKKGKTKFIGVVFNPDKDTAYKRGTWLKSKVLDDSGKQIITGFWVKEVSSKA